MGNKEALATITTCHLAASTEHMVGVPVLQILYSGRRCTHGCGPTQLCPSPHVEGGLIALEENRGIIADFFGETRLNRFEVKVKRLSPNPSQ